MRTLCGQNERQVAWLIPADTGKGAAAIDAFPADRRLIMALIGGRQI
jgi:hypothetical protein